MQRVIVLPAPAAETYTAHATAIPAVQFNTVYPTPCTTVPSIRIGAASDKRYSLGVKGTHMSHSTIKLSSLPLVDVVDPGPELNVGVAHMCAFDA